MEVTFKVTVAVESDAELAEFVERLENQEAVVRVEELERVVKPVAKNTRTDADVDDDRQALMEESGDWED